MNKNFDLMNAFGRLYFMANYSSTTAKHQINCKFVVNSMGVSNRLPSTLASNLDLNSWVKVSLSLKSNLGSTYDYYLHFYSGGTISSYSSLNQADFF
jgi:hypothetical protein